jgi:hypothetical protein
MNSRQRIHLHLHCLWLRPNHFWFHSRGIGREVPIFVFSIVAAVLAQWAAWHLK